MREKLTTISQIDVGTHFYYNGIDGVLRRYQKCQPCAARDVLLFMYHRNGKIMSEVQFAIDNHGFIHPFNEEEITVIEQGD